MPPRWKQKAQRRRKEKDPTHAPPGEEDALQAECNRICDQLVAMGKICAWWHRPNHKPTTQERRQRGTAGLQDLILFLPGGRYLAVELKTATGRESAEQVAWRVALEPYSAVCRSVGEFLDFVGPRT